MSDLQINFLKQISDFQNIRISGVWWWRATYTYSHKIRIPGISPVFSNREFWGIYSLCSFDCKLVCLPVCPKICQNFLMAYGRAFIFYIFVFLATGPFFWVLKLLTLWFHLGVWLITCTSYFRKSSLVLIFEYLVMGLSYFTSLNETFLTSWPWSLANFWKTFNLGYKFWMVSDTM